VTTPEQSASRPRWAAPAIGALDSGGFGSMPRPSAPEALRGTVGDRIERQRAKAADTCRKNFTKYRHWIDAGGISRPASAHPLYTIYQHARARCENRSHERYEDYGARGIRLYPQWATPRRDQAEPSRTAPRHDLALWGPMSRPEGYDGSRPTVHRLTGRCGRKVSRFRRLGCGELVVWVGDVVPARVRGGAPARPTEVDPRLSPD
jgi:hypothetical protein